MIFQLSNVHFLAKSVFVDQVDGDAVDLELLLPGWKRCK